MSGPQPGGYLPEGENVVSKVVQDPMLPQAERVVEAQSTEKLKEHVVDTISRLLTVGYLNEDRIVMAVVADVSQVEIIAPKTLIAGLVAEAQSASKLQSGEHGLTEMIAVITNLGEGEPGLKRAGVINRWKKTQEQYDASGMEVYNRPLTYHRIILALLSCLDAEHKLEQVLTEYQRELSDFLLTFSASQEVAKVQGTLYDDRDGKHKNLVLGQYQLVKTLVDGIRDAGVLEGKSLLEIGGSGLRILDPERELDISGKLEKYADASSRINESAGFFDNQPSIESHVTTANYQQIVGSEPYDVTVTRGVFDMGSGVKGNFETEGKAVEDLLQVLSLITKKGGFSVHEGSMPPPSDDKLKSLGFELITIIEPTSGNDYGNLLANVGSAQAKIDLEQLRDLAENPHPQLEIRNKEGETLIRNTGNKIEIVDRNSVYQYTWVVRKI